MRLFTRRKFVIIRLAFPGCRTKRHITSNTRQLMLMHTHTGAFVDILCHNGLCGLDHRDILRRRFAKRANRETVQPTHHTNPVRHNIILVGSLGDFEMGVPAGPQTNRDSLPSGVLGGLAAPC